MRTRVRIDLTKSAERDMQLIARSTRDRWGTAQARTYILDLQEGLARAALGLRPLRRLSPLHPDVIRVNLRSHVAVGMIVQDAQGAPVFKVLRIAHGRSDLIALLDTLGQ